jgi:PAS domain S-box-containing protein
MSDAAPTLVSFYDYRLVFLSVLLAIFASYVALDLAARVTITRGRARHAWLAGGAVSMGLGIWSMHFVGMLAFRLPIPVFYDLPTVLLSLLAAILASTIALYLVSHRRFGWPEALAGSLLMGGGIAGMHYLGMASMRLSAMCHYNPLLVGLSIVIAIVSSLAALTLVFDFHDEPRGKTRAKITGAVCMGLAIASMHYTGMGSATFVPSNLTADFSDAVSISGLGVAGVVIVTMMTLWFTLPITQMERQFATQALELEITEERYRLLFEHCFAGAYRTTLEGLILDCNDAYAHILGYTSRDECLARNAVESYYTPADWEALITLLKEKKTLSNLELRLRAKDGRPVWVFGNLTLLEGTGSVPQMVEGTLIDITDRKFAEQLLRKAHDELEARVIERTVELANINEALMKEIAEHKQAELELQRLSSQLLHLQDEERRSIARDLHDSTGQLLVALAMIIKQLLGSLPSSKQKLRGLLAECEALANQCIRQIRTLSYLLHPPLLEERGLEDAMRHYLEGFAKRSGIQVLLEVSSDFGRLARDVELAFFRVAQEGLANVQRHSGSSQAKIRLSRSADEVILEVGDNGPGACGESEALPFEVGVGITSMNERVKLIGGQLMIASGSQGTIVRVTLPLRGDQRAKAAHSGS